MTAVTKGKSKVEEKLKQPANDDSETNTPIKNKISVFFTVISRVWGFIAAVAAILGLGYGIGFNMGSSTYEKSKVDLLITNTSLLDTIRHYKTLLNFDELNKLNWEIGHTSNISFNKSYNKQFNSSYSHLFPTVTLSTTTYPCIGGPNWNKCWTMEREINKNDTLSLQIIYINDMPYPVPNVAVEFHLYPFPLQNKTIFQGGILVGGQLVDWGIASAYYKISGTYKLKFLPHRTVWSPKTSVRQRIDVVDIKPGIIELANLGIIPAHEKGYVIFSFLVE